jgi:hypothetical protein
LRRQKNASQPLPVLGKSPTCRPYLSFITSRYRVRSRAPEAGCRSAHLPLFIIFV